MIAMSKELVAWDLTLLGDLARLINLKQRKFFSALELIIKNVICKST